MTWQNLPRRVVLGLLAKALAVGAMVGTAQVVQAKPPSKFSGFGKARFGVSSFGK